MQNVLKGRCGRKRSSTDNESAAFTDQTYLQMLEIMIPRLNDLFVNENEVYFQQDGALPHFHVNVRNFLNRTFNQRWIGRKKKCYVVPASISRFNPSRFLEELRHQIEHAINDTR